MWHLLNFSRYPAVAVFLLMGASGGLFAWNTFDLVQLSMANFDLIRRFGWMAFLDGGFLQLAGIVAKGYLSLLFYLAFKFLESDLVRRWRNTVQAKPYDETLVGKPATITPTPSPPAPPNS